MDFVFFMGCAILVILVYPSIGCIIVGDNILKGWDKNKLTFVGKAVYYFFIPSRWVYKAINNIDKIPFSRIFFKKEN